MDINYWHHEFCFHLVFRNGRVRAPTCWSLEFKQREQCSRAAQFWNGGIKNANDRDVQIVV